MFTVRNHIRVLEGFARSRRASKVVPFAPANAMASLTARMRDALLDIKEHSPLPRSNIYCKVIYVMIWVRSLQQKLSICILLIFTRLKDHEIDVRISAVLIFLYCVLLCMVPQVSFIIRLFLILHVLE